MVLLSFLGAFYRELRAQHQEQIRASAGRARTRPHRLNVSLRKHRGWFVAQPKSGGLPQQITTDQKTPPACTGGSVVSPWLHRVFDQAIETYLPPPAPPHNQMFARAAAAPLAAPLTAPLHTGRAASVGALSPKRGQSPRIWQHHSPHLVGLLPRVAVESFVELR